MTEPPWHPPENIPSCPAVRRLACLILCVFCVLCVQRIDTLICHVCVRVPEEIPANANDGCVGPQSEAAGLAPSCAGCPNQAACAAGKGREVDPAVAEVASKMANIKHKILVLSVHFFFVSACIRRFTSAPRSFREWRVIRRRL